VLSHFVSVAIEDSHLDHRVAMIVDPEKYSVVIVTVWQYAGIDSARLMLSGKAADSAPVLSSWRKVRRSVFIGIQYLYLRFVTLLRGLRCDLQTCNETQFHNPSRGATSFYGSPRF
jgi:hypothetical protein